MFGSGFDLGFGVTDLQSGIGGFIGLAPVVVLIIGVLVLMFIPRVVGEIGDYPFSDWGVFE